MSLSRWLLWQTSRDCRPSFSGSISARQRAPAVDNTAKSNMFRLVTVTLGGPMHNAARA